MRENYKEYRVWRDGKPLTFSDLSEAKEEASRIAWANYRYMPAPIQVREVSEWKVLDDE